MPVLSSKSLLLFLIVLLIQSAGPAIAAGGEAAVLYEQGLQAFEAGNSKEAKIHIKNALQQDPNLLAARILLGRIYIAEGDGGNADKQFDLAQRLGANPQLLAVPRARSLLLQRRYRDVVDKVDARYDDPALNAALMAYRGAALMELGEYDAAQQAYQRAADFTPEAAAPLIGLGQVYLHQGKFAEAEQAAVEALMREPDNADGWNLKGSIEHAKGALDAALTDYEKALQLKPDAVDVQVSRIGLLVDLKRFQQAVDAARVASQHHPYDPRLSYLRAVAYGGLGDQAAADAAMKQAGELLTRIPDDILRAHPASLMLAGLVNFSLRQWEQARKYLHDYLQARPDEVGPRKLLGTILLAEGEAEKAVKVLEPGQTRAGDDLVFLGLLGEAYLKTARYRQANDVLDQALVIDPGNSRIRTQRAINSLALGRQSAAIGDLIDAFEHEPGNARVGAMLFLLDMRQHHYPEAAATANKLLQQQPENPAYHNLLASALYAQGDRETARDHFEQALAYDADFLPARINLAKLDRSEGQLQRARQRLLGILKDKPENATVMLELARTLVVQGQVEEAIRWLEKARSVATGDLATLGMLVNLLIDRGDLERAQAVAEDAEKVDSADVRVLEALGRLALLKGERDRARLRFGRMSVEAEAKEDAALLVRVAEYQQQAGDLMGAIVSLNKAVEFSPDLLRARVLLAQRLAEDHQIDKAQAVAEAIVKDYPDKAVGPRMLADLAMLRGEYGKALAIYRQAISEMPDSMLIISAAHAYQVAGKPTEARGLLQDWLAKHTDDASVRKALAEDYLRAGQWAAARDEYERVLEADAGDATTWNNLAMIYDHEGQTKALEYARKAYELDPQSAAINDSLGWLLVKQGDAAAGLKYLRNAQARQPQDRETRYHIAVALQGIGLPDQARSLLEELLAGPGNEHWRTDAQRLLSELTSS